MLKPYLIWFVYCLSFLTAAWFAYHSWISAQETAVVVEWSTANELDTAGFFLSRSSSPQGPFQRVNQEMIPASGDMLTGGSYHFEDKNLRAGQLYYYQLEDITLSGKASRSSEVLKVQSKGPRLSMFYAALFLALISFRGLWLQSPRKM